MLRRIASRASCVFFIALPCLPAVAQREVMIVGGGPVADLGVTNVGPQDLTAGALARYAVTVTNNGPGAVPVTLTEIPPPGTTAQQGALPPTGWTCSISSGVMTCSNASFPPGTASFELLLRSDMSLPAGTVINNTVTLSSPAPDPDPANNSASWTVTVDRYASLILQMQAPRQAIIGEPFHYSISVMNLGESDAESLVLTDVLPAGIRFNSLTTPAGWSCTTPAAGTTGTVTCTLPRLTQPANDLIQILVTADASLAVPTNITNRVTLTSTTPPAANQSLIYETYTSTTTPVSLQSFDVE